MLTDVKEHDDHYDLEVELPGFKKEDIGYIYSKNMGICINRGCLKPFPRG